MSLYRLVLGLSLFVALGGAACAQNGDDPTPSQAQPAIGTDNNYNVMRTQSGQGGLAFTNSATSDDVAAPSSNDAATPDSSSSTSDTQAGP